MIRYAMLALAGLALAVVVACGGGAAPVAPTAVPVSGSESASVPAQPAAPLPREGNEPAAAPETQVQSLAAGSGRDLATIPLCRLLTPEEVATMAGGTVDQEALQSNSETGALCVYHIGFSEGAYQQVRISLQPANLVEPLVDCCSADLGQPVAGLGDVAFLERDEAAEQLTLLALVRNDFALEVTGTGAGGAPVSEEVIRQLAGILLPRLLQRE